MKRSIITRRDGEAMRVVLEIPDDFISSQPRPEPNTECSLPCRRYRDTGSELVLCKIMLERCGTCESYTYCPVCGTCSCGQPRRLTYPEVYDLLPEGMKLILDKREKKRRARHDIG